MSLRGFDFWVRSVWNIELSHWLWMTLAALATDDEDVLVQRHQLGALDAALVSWERSRVDTSTARTDQPQQTPGPGRDCGDETLLV